MGIFQIHGPTTPLLPCNGPSVLIIIFYWYCAGLPHIIVRAVSNPLLGQAREETCISEL